MKIKPDLLQEKVEKLFRDSGLCEESAESAARCMICADRYGVSTHGLSVLPSHLKKIRAGGYNLNPGYRVLRESPSFTVVDAENAIGFAAGTHCMKLAIKKSGEYGVHTVFCRHSNTYGAAFCYPLMAAREGRIGITCSNSPAAMAPIGGKEKLFGTNPFSFVFPTGDPERPVIIDMATSKVAKSKFLQAKEMGKQLPDGWALDKNGQPTNDPDAGLEGLVCPMEGYKGYGMAMIIDLMAGLLSGAGYQDGVGKFYCDDNVPMDVGQVFVAISPEKILGDRYPGMMDRYIKRIYSSEAVSEDRPVMLPGDRKLRAYRNMREAIEISDEIGRIIGI